MTRYGLAAEFDRRRNDIPDSKREMTGAATGNVVSSSV